MGRDIMDRGGPGADLIRTVPGLFMPSGDDAPMNLVAACDMPKNGAPAAQGFVVGMGRDNQNATHR